MSGMNRRQALRIGVAAALPLAASDLFALARTVHASLPSQDDRDRYVFQSLDADQSEVLKAACALILPETDTPGALAARVPEFIDAMLTGWFSEAERRLFLKGLRELDSRARLSGRAGFPSLAEAEQIRILQEMESEAFEELSAVEQTHQAHRKARSTPDAPFFTVLKWLTLYGYYTSEVGMERELEFEEFPGTYDGCAPRRGG
jgi:hypothetical protein